MAGNQRKMCAVFAALGAAALWAGCGSSSRSGSFPAGDGGPGSDGSNVGGDATSDSPSLFGDGGGEAAPSCTTCSADLHQILDCNNPPSVVATCPDDQGCGANGQCVAPCDAAAANKSSIGCDYYTIPADGWSNIPLNPSASQVGASDGSCFAAFVTNNWGTPMTVSLEYNGTTMDAAPHAYVPQGSGSSITYTPIPSTGIPAGQMAIVFLAQYGSIPAGDEFKVLCPTGVSPAITSQDVGLHGTGIGTAIHLTTSVPAVAYDIYPYGGASSYISSATLLLPTDVWDVNYVAVAASAGQPSTGSTTEGFPMDVEIIGLQDNTTVQILPIAPIAAGGTVPASPANTPAAFTLNKGQLLQFAQLADLSGSPIQAERPGGRLGRALLHEPAGFDDSRPATPRTSRSRPSRPRAASTSPSGTARARLPRRSPSRGASWGWSAGPHSRSTRRSRAHRRRSRSARWWSSSRRDPST